MADFNCENKYLQLRVEELERELERSVRKEKAFRSLVEGSQDICTEQTPRGSLPIFHHR